MNEKRGTIRWFARNPVAANLLMITLLLGGIFVGFGVRQEVFPDFRLDIVRVSVPYPGASPSEVEQGIILAVEESIRDVDGVDRITSAAVEGGGSVYVSLELDAVATTVMSDIKNGVDRLTSLPQEAERPTVSLVTNRFEVISLILHGDVEQQVLRDLAEQVRDELLGAPGITNVDLAGAPPREIAIEVSQAELRTHGLTLEAIAGRVAGTALELPGGSIKTSAGEVLLRTSERRRTADEFAAVPVLTSSTGTELTLGDIAAIQETFEETDEAAWYGNEPAIMLRVYRTGEQTPIEVSARVHTHLERLQKTLPEGVSIASWVDWSEIYRQRMNLLVRNAFIGLVLVLFILGMFLELRLAFWVTMGIPVSFLGALLLMPPMDVTINMISLFAFIVTLGMVVDDAIVVGENIFEMRQRGIKPMKASIMGAREVSIPVVFAIATTIVAFSPMLFVPGFSGKLYRVIPSIVIAVLLISLIESLWVLPAHLAAVKEPETTGLYAAFYRRQQVMKRALERFISAIYAPALSAALRRRYVSLTTGVAILVIAGGFVAGGRIPFRFMPDIAGDVAVASLEMPYGSPIEETRRIQERILESAQLVLAENGEDGIVRGVFSQLGTPMPGDPGQARVAVPGGHLANVQVYFVDAGDRVLKTEAFLARWRERLGNVAGAEKLSFTASIGPSPGPPVSVELQHDDMNVLDAASADLAESLRGYPEIYEVDDGFSLGKPQLDLKLTSEATSVGMASADVARQVRSAFYGAEALRQQEGRNEIKVVVRLPRHERRTVHHVESLLLRTPAGGEIPLAEAATIDSGRAWPVIQRANGHRMVEVTAKVRADTSPNVVIADLEAGPLVDLEAKYPGLSYEFGGSQREQAKALGSLGTGAILASIGVFVLLAIPFKSYLQPIIVMVAIPFGVVGAIIGHVIMGFELSMISVMGLVALGGVVINDSLVLIDAANRFRRDGLPAAEAIHAAGVRRFRPILLTSLTTFFGLTPMILESSVQAQFLVPMAISLGFGVLFATFIILLLVPAFYLLLEDVADIFRRGAPYDPGDSQASGVLPRDPAWSAASSSMSDEPAE